MNDTLRKLYDTVTDKGLVGISADIEMFLNSDTPPEAALWSLRGTTEGLGLCLREIKKAIDESKIDIEKMQAEYIARQGQGK